MIEVTIWAALFAGLLSFISPCVLPLVPAYLGFISNAKTSRIAGLNALVFILGFSAVFVGLGALAGFFGLFALREFPWIMALAGTIVMILGLQMILVALNVKWAKRVFAFLYREKRFQSRSAKDSRLKPFVMGFAFGFGWMPCIGPILGAILTLAYSSQTASQGALLLAVYSAGLGIPFLASALFATSITRLIRKMGRAYLAVEIISGLMLIGLGALIATNNLVLLNAWFYRIIS